MTQEVLRILKNCCVELPWEQVIQHVNVITMRMQFSGYNKKFRYEVVNSALKAYRTMLLKDLAGKVPLYRPKGWMEKEREEAKRLKKNNWYKSSNYKSVIFVPATPSSMLKKRLQRDVNESGLKIKIVEKSGTSIKRILQRSDPFKEKKCSKDDCLVCSTGGSGPCSTTNVNYRIKCNECDSTYIGETSRSTYTRGKEHLRALNAKSENSVLWKHAVEHHESALIQFSCDVTECFRKDSLLRQVTEAVKINREKPTMNTKSEWNVVNIPRTQIE